MKGIYGNIYDVPIECRQQFERAVEHYNYDAVYHAQVHLVGQLCTLVGRLRKRVIRYGRLPLCDGCGQDVEPGTQHTFCSPGMP